MSSSGQSLAGEYASELDDTVLVREAQNGNIKAFEELARHYDQAVLALALHLTGSREDAQDIYQDVFLRAYQNLPHFRFECSFYTWLYRIVANQCLDRLRRNRLQKVDVSVEVPTDGLEEERLAQMPELRKRTCPERSSSGHEVGERVGRALSQLSARERMVFELKHYQGLKLSSVARLLDTTENTIKSIFLRATQKLRVELGELR
jgi:RNA polymerase sigma-70 factor (ECF subfamily)